MSAESPAPGPAGPTPPELRLFDHLRPTLWWQSKVAHITLFVLGSLMVFPACMAMVGFYQMHQYLGKNFLDEFDPQEATLMLGMAASSNLGILAWVALGLMFFKRSDARWQRVGWRVCSIFGMVATPSIGFLIVYTAREELPSQLGWLYLIMLLMLSTSLAAAILGHRYSRTARRSLKHPPTTADQVAR